MRQERVSASAGAPLPPKRQASFSLLHKQGAVSLFLGVFEVSSQKSTSERPFSNPKTFEFAIDNQFSLQQRIFLDRSRFFLGVS